MAITQSVRPWAGLGIGESTFPAAVKVPPTATPPLPVARACTAASLPTTLRPAPAPQLQDAACTCGVIFTPDSVYCRRCGARRPASVENGMRSCVSTVLPTPKLGHTSSGTTSGRSKAGCSDLAFSMQEVAHLLREALRLLCEELRVVERNNELLEAQCAHYVTELRRKRQACCREGSSASRRVTWSRSARDPRGTCRPSEGGGSFSSSGGRLTRHRSEDGLASDSSGSELFEPNSPSEIEEALQMFHGRSRGRTRSTLSRRMTLKLQEDEERREVHERATQSLASTTRLSGSTSSSDGIPVECQQ